MGLLSKEIKSLDDLFVHGLQDMYYAEQQIVKSLPKMIESATDSRLKSSLEQHLRETENQVKRLEKVFDMHGEQPKGSKCPAMDGILEEGDEIMGEAAQEVRDAALIGAAQAVEHYEITRYGTLITWAKELGHNDWARLLKQTLDEEKATDKKLTVMAEKNINPEAREETTPRRAGAKRKSAASSRKRTSARAGRSSARKSKTQSKKKASSRRSA